MPRPLDLDDENDRPRPAKTSGSVPVPVLMWVLIGGGAIGLFAVLAAVGVTWWLLSKPAEPEVNATPEVASAPAEFQAPQPTKSGKDRTATKVKEPELPVVLMDTIAEAYQSDRNAADAKYKGKRLRVEITARKSGNGWVGTVAQLTTPQIRRISAAQAARERQEAASRGWVPNVVFFVPVGQVEDHKRAVIEGTCAGIAPDASTGLKLTFTNARIVP